MVLGGPEDGGTGIGLIACSMQQAWDHTSGLGFMGLGGPRDSGVGVGSMVSSRPGITEGASAQWYRMSPGVVVTKWGQWY